MQELNIYYIQLLQSHRYQEGKVRILRSTTVSKRKSANVSVTTEAVVTDTFQARPREQYNKQADVMST